MLTKIKLHFSILFICLQTTMTFCHIDDHICWATHTSKYHVTSEIESIYKRCILFLQKYLNTKYKLKIEHNQPLFIHKKHIYHKVSEWSTLSKLFFIQNAKLGPRHSRNYYWRVCLFGQGNHPWVFAIKAYIFIDFNTIFCVLSNALQTFINVYQQRKFTQHYIFYFSKRNFMNRTTCAAI